eukprot:6211015-Pleurochrysis_carterae.AAC.2
MRRARSVWKGADRCKCSADCLKRMQVEDQTKQRTIFTKRPKGFTQRDAVATDESAGDRRADAQIDRSSSASDACT